MEDEPKLKPGEEFLGKYEVCDVMCGSMAFVYVMKNIRRQHFAEPDFVCAKTFHSKWMSSDYAKTRFIEEVEHWLLLGRYAHIICAYDYRDVNGIPYVVIEFADSGSLRTLRRHGFDPLCSVEEYYRGVAFAFGLALGMQRIYDTLMVPHGDLRPDNVLFTQRGNLVKVSDFGIMAAVKSSKSRAARNDIVQFGRVLWYLFTGEEAAVEQILDNIDKHPQIALPVRELIVDALRVVDHDASAFFAEAAERINRYVFDVSGEHFPTPEEHLKEHTEKLQHAIGDVLDKKFGLSSIKSFTADSPALYINRAASLGELGKTEEAFENILMALKIVRHWKGSEEVRLAWSTLRFILGQFRDINKRREYFQQALTLWRQSETET